MITVDMELNAAPAVSAFPMKLQGVGSYELQLFPRIMGFSGSAHPTALLIGTWEPSKIIYTQML